MQDIARAFSEGGPFMLVVLVTGLLHAIPVLAQLALVKKVDLTPYLWGGLAAILALGFAGALWGLSSSLGAMANAPPEMKAMLLARGTSTVLNTSGLTAIITLPGFFLTGIASSLVRHLRPVRVKG